MVFWRTINQKQQIEELDWDVKHLKERVEKIKEESDLQDFSSNSNPRDSSRLITDEENNDRTLMNPITASPNLSHACLHRAKFSPLGAAYLYEGQKGGSSLFCLRF